MQCDLEMFGRNFVIIFIFFFIPHFINRKVQMHIIGNRNIGSKGNIQLRLDQTR